LESCVYQVADSGAKPNLPCFLFAAGCAKIGLLPKFGAIAMRLVVLLVLLFAAALPSSAEDYFSCPIGRRAACLQYGDKIVDQGAQCFSSYTCGYGGFVCKSDLTELADQYDELLRKAKAMATEYDSYRNCILRASTLNDTRYC
jgi:hypothetical protein